MNDIEKQYEMSFFEWKCQIFVSGCLEDKRGGQKSNDLSPFPQKSNSERQSICPFKEYTFIKHPLMRLGKSQQGMFLTINTPK